MLLGEPKVTLPFALTQTETKVCSQIVKGNGRKSSIDPSSARAAPLRGPGHSPGCSRRAPGRRRPGSAACIRSERRSPRCRIRWPRSAKTPRDPDGDRRGAEAAVEDLIDVHRVLRARREAVEPVGPGIGVAAGDAEVTGDRRNGVLEGIGQVAGDHVDTGELRRAGG